jgi:hypothetical protein
VTIAKPDVITGHTERNPSWPYVLQMAFWKSIPILKEALVKLTLGQSTLKICVFTTEIMDDFILGLDVL